MKILVMPGGDFGPHDQHRVGVAIAALQGVGAEDFAVQAVMPKRLPPSKFMGWRARARINHIIMLTNRRVHEIHKHGGKVSGVVADYEYEPLQDLTPDEHGRAVTRVSRAVNANSLYAIGTDRHSKRAVAKLVEACEYPWLCMPQFHYSRNHGQPHDPLPDIRLADELGIEAVPYVQGLMWVDGKPVEVTVEQLRFQFKRLGDLGVRRCIGWCGIKTYGFVGSVERVLEAAA